MVLGLKNLNVLNRIRSFEGVHAEKGVGKRNVDGRRLLEFCNKKEL